MLPLAPHIAPDLTPQCRSIPQKRLSVWANRQLCYTGHTTATKYRQEHVAADAVIRDTALEAHVRSPNKPDSDDSNSGTFVASRVGDFDVSGHHSTTASAQCSACALDNEQRALQAGWLPDTSAAAHSRLQALVVLKRRLPVGGQDSSNTDNACRNSQVQQDAQLLHARSAPTQHLQQQEQQQGQTQQLQQQQQQQQQQLVHDAAAAMEYQKNISRSLRAENCGSIEQLVAVVSQHGPQMDAHSVTASFSAAARLAKQQQQQQQQQQQLRSTPAAADSSWCQFNQQLRDVLEADLLPLLQTRLRQMDPVGLQVVLHALASLQYQEEVVISQLETAVTPVVQHLPPGCLCQLVWSLGKLAFKPNRQLSRSVLHCSRQCMPILTGQDLTQLLHGLVQLQLFPAQAWMDGCCARVLQLCAHQQLEPRALCSVLHSLAHLLTAQQQQQQQQPLVAAGVPPQEALSSQQQLQQQATQSNAGGLPAPLLLQLLKETQRALQATAAPTAVQPNRSVAQHVQLSEEANGSMQQLQMQWNLARAPHAGHQQLDHRQQQAWMHGQQHHQQGLTPAGLVMLTDALRQLKTDPPQEWQAAYVAAAQQLMHTSDARNLPLMLAPCVRWQHAPGPAWLQQYLAACECLLPNMQAQGLAVLGHSLAALQVQPSAAWLSAYMAAAASQRLAGTPAGCSVLMHTLGVWQQLGLLQQQQQLGSAAGVGPCSSRGVGRAVDDVPVGAGAKAAAAAVSGAQAAAAAAAGQQLEVQAQQLAEECLRCFRGQGHSFTAEQFGMFCKGLAQWGIRVGPQLGEQLEQVALQVLGHRHQRHKGARQQRLTAATLCNILLALAVACPEAATPVLLSRLWAVWSAWLLSTTTAAHAAGVAWAAGRLGVQPPQAFAGALLQQLTVVPEGVQAQHVAAVLLQAKVGAWQVHKQHVVLLVGTMLQQQAAGLAGMRQAAAAGPQQQQHQQLAEAVGANSMRCEHLGVCHCGACAGGSTYSSGQPGASSLQPRYVSGSSSSTDSGSTCSGPAAARLYGLANHRLKGYVRAAACAAAWCDVLPQKHLQLAAQLYSRASELLPADERLDMQAHVHMLRSALMKSSSPPSTAAAAAVLAAAAPLHLAQRLPTAVKD